MEDDGLERMMDYIWNMGGEGVDNVILGHKNYISEIWNIGPIVTIPNHEIFSKVSMHRI